MDLFFISVNNAQLQKVVAHDKHTLCLLPEDFYQNQHDVLPLTLD